MAASWNAKHSIMDRVDCLAWLVRGQDVVRAGHVVISAGPLPPTGRPRQANFRACPDWARTDLATAPGLRRLPASHERSLRQRRIRLLIPLLHPVLPARLPLI